MQKTSIGQSLFHLRMKNRPLLKPLLIVKAAAVLLLFTCLPLAAKTAAQITLSEKNAPLEQILKVISHQSGYNLFYDEALVKQKGKPVDITVKDASVDQTLSLVFSQQPLAYEIAGGTILVKEKEKGKEELPPAVSSQPFSVTGKVTTKTGEALIAVTVSIKGANKGTTTDADGCYSIQVTPSDKILVFSIIGMTAQEVAINGRTHINVIMENSFIELDNVAVIATGYQKLNAREKTASISTVKMEQMGRIVQPSIEKLLQGQVPGMTIMSTSGAPGSIPQIRIRGTSSISGNVQPLWVVDGIILDDPINVDVGDILTNRKLIASGIGGVNVNDIASINVLKDASATALYGTRAAAGVIVITSKSGKAGKTTINYSGNTTISMRPRIEDAYMMNSKERIDVNIEMIKKGIFKASSPEPGIYNTASDFERYFIDVHDRKISWGDFENRVKELETVNTDWFKHLFRDAITNQHSLSVSGGNELTTYYFSGSYMDEQATAKGVGQQTYTGSLRLTTQLKKNMRVTTNLRYSSRKNKSFFALDSQENPYEYAINTTRAHRAYTEDGKYNYFYINGGYKYNFEENRNDCWRESQSFSILGSVDLEWKILPDLTFNSTFSFSNQSTREENIATEDSYFIRSRKDGIYKDAGYTTENVWFDGGYYNGANTLNNSKTIRNAFDYRPTIGENHRFNFVLGQEVRTQKYSSVNDIIYGYQHERGHQLAPQWKLIELLGTPYWDTRLSQTNGVAYFGVASYTLNDKYTVNFNARTDGSNRFGIKTNDLFQPLWSAGFNYQIKNENYFKDIEWISYLTLRGSYGSQGNVASQAYADLVTNIGTTNPIKKETYLSIIAPKNPSLKWEKNYTVNIALEAGFFNRKLMATIEYYNKKGVDLLGSKEVSDVSGFDRIQVNWASMRNRGIDFSLSSINIDNEIFRWATSINGGYNDNEILAVYAKPGVADLTNTYRTSYSSTAVVGKPINGLWSYRYAGLNTDGRATFYNGKYKKDGNGQNILDENGNPIELTVLAGMKDVKALKHEGTTMPPVQLSFTNTFSYKKFTFSSMFIGSFGNVIRLRNLTTSYDMVYPNPMENLSKELVNRWRKPGDEVFTDIPKFEVDEWDADLTGTSPYNTQMYNASDLRTVKGDFVRLQNITLSYDLYNEFLRKKGIQNIRISVQGNNLYAWYNSKLKGQDPEATGALMSRSSTNSANVSFGNTYLPLSRTFSISLNVQF